MSCIHLQATRERCVAPTTLAINLIGLVCILSRECTRTEELPTVDYHIQSACLNHTTSMA